MLINDNEENDSREIYLHDDNINFFFFFENPASKGPLFYC